MAREGCWGKGWLKIYHIDREGLGSASRAEYGVLFFLADSARKRGCSRANLYAIGAPMACGCTR